MYTINMPLSNPYNIIVKDGIFDYIDEEIQKVYKNKKVYIITDERVANLYLEKITNSLKSFDVKSIVIKGYEESKSLDMYAYICEELIKNGAVRGELLVALGGGVIGDLVGFIAATLYRGMPFIQIPTSLLAQVDSSIGGKTGIDFIGHKNILGAFNQPKLVLIDPQFLRTLPIRELKNGYAEMIKHAFIYSPKLLSLLKEYRLNVTEEIIYENLLIKRAHVIGDEFDNGVRMKLNFGHTFGHIIELKNNCLHGEAVIDGMLCAINYAIDLGLIKFNVKDELINLYETLELDYHEYDYHEFFGDVKYDKKNIAETINFILLEEIGKAIIYKVKVGELV